MLCCASLTSGATTMLPPMMAMNASRSITGEAPVDAVAAVAVDGSASAPAGQTLFSCGAGPPGFGVIRDFSLVNYLIAICSFIGLVLF
jgi:hypothetical protein